MNKLKKIRDSFTYIGRDGKEYHVFVGSSVAVMNGDRCGIFGEVVDFDKEEGTCRVTFDTGSGGGTMTFSMDDICLGCKEPVKDCLDWSGISGKLEVF